MNRKVWSAGLVSCVALLCVGSTLLADDAADSKAAKAAARAEAKAAHSEAKAAGKPAGAAKGLNDTSVKLPPDFQEMAKALNLDQDTQLKLAEIAKVRSATAKQFEDDHAAERTKLAADIAAAKTAGNKDAAKEAMTKQKDLGTQEKAKVAPYEDAALALLTPEQVTNWKIHKITREVMAGSLHAVKLTDDQASQVKGLVTAQLPALATAGDNEKARNPIIKSLQDSIVKNVLTGDQIAAMQNHGGGEHGKAGASTQPSTK